MPSSTTKRALITGAGAADGIGFAIARQLGLAGLAVFLNGASARVLDRAAELCAEGINAKAAVADLTPSVIAGHVCFQATVKLDSATEIRRIPDRQIGGRKQTCSLEGFGFKKRTLSR